MIWSKSYSISFWKFSFSSFTTWTQIKCLKLDSFSAINSFILQNKLMGGSVQINRVAVWIEDGHMKRWLWVKGVFNVRQDVSSNVR